MYRLAVRCGSADRLLRRCIGLHLGHGRVAHCRRSLRLQGRGISMKGAKLKSIFYAELTHRRQLY